MEKSRIENQSSGEVKLKAASKQEWQICWEKTDRKSKKVNFLLTQSSSKLQEKATADTIEDIAEKIENLHFKLDEISMNIVSQVESEAVHFECKSFVTQSCYRRF